MPERTAASSRPSFLFCQVCGFRNPEEQEYCRRCNQKLLVVSGPLADEEDEDAYEVMEESFSFDEHLLERISILEEAVKRTAETVRQLLGALRKQERNALINHAGLETVRELLEDKEVVRHEEWSELWESKMDFQLLALEKRERFLSARERIAALYRGDRRTTFQRLLDDAEYALYAFDVDGALAALEEAFKLDRRNYELAYLLGEIYFNEAETERALTFFGRVLEVKPDHYEGLVFSGVLRHEMGDDEGAEQFLKRAVALYPESFLPNFSLGAVYARSGHLGRAVTYLERATEIDPLPQAQFLLGRCLYEMGKLTASIRALREAVRLDPAFEEAHHLLGLACLDRGWTKKALASFRVAQRLNPKKLTYHDLVRYLSGHSATPLPEVGGEAADWLARGEKYLEGEKLTKALPCYRRALSLAPDNPTLLMSYAMLCLHLDRSQEIEAVTRKVLDGQPGEMLEATAYATLIAALRSQGKYREGNRIGRELLSQARSPFTKTIAYYEMAYNLAEMEEDLDHALEYARHSLDLAPEELRQFPLAALGWVHYKRQELDEAIDCLTRSTELGASSTVLTHLGMALLAAGEEGKARDVLAQAGALDLPDEHLEERMMSCLKNSHRLFQRVQQRQKK